MATDTYPARRERDALCDLFEEVGPDAPTLCGEWTTRDLAAHLVMRERRPDGAVGIVFSKAAGYADKVQSSIAENEWTELVETIRSGPPLWSPTKISKVDKLANTVEFFVHHEDVRRGGDTWEPRSLDDDLEDALYGVMSKMAKQLTKRSEIGIVFDPSGDRQPITANTKEPSVRVRGPIGELVLFAYGRQANAEVEIFGDEASAATVKSASFGI